MTKKDYELIAASILYGNEWMTADKEGRIGRIGADGYRVTPSDNWRIVGAVECNNFGHVVRRYSLAQLLANPNAIPWQFKNGKQRTFIVDFDHGTRRQWRSPSHRMTA